MKKLLTFTIAFISFYSIANAQSCDIQIKILENKYMFGHVSKINNDQLAQEINVHFTSEVMEVIMPVDGQNYLIKVVNQDCQAYCTKAKRVRQLHSGDENLVKNLFKDKEEDIMAQIRSCNN